MAYVNNVWKDDEEDNGQEGQNQVQLSNQNSGFVNQGSGGAVAAQPGGEKRSSGSWTNLMSYVDANKGNDEKMASKVTSDVGSKATELGTTSSGYASGFKNAADSSSLKQNNDLVSAIKNSPTNVKKDDFSAYYNGGYKGPTDTSNYNSNEAAKLNNDFSSFQDVTSKADTNEGRSQLLKNSYDRPSYSLGEQNLDSFIVGGSDVGAQAMQGIKSQYKDTASGWDGLKNSLVDYGSKAKAETDKAVSEVKSAYDSAFGSTKEAIDATKASLATQNSALDKQRDSLREQLQSTDPIDRSAGYKKLGLQFQQGEYLRSQGFDVLNRIVSDTTRQSLGDVVDGSQAANYNALVNLANKESDFDFRKNNGVASAYAVNNDLTKAARSALELETNLKSTLASEQSKYDNFSQLSPQQISQELGVPLNELEWFAVRLNTPSGQNMVRTPEKINKFYNDLREEIKNRKGQLQVGDIVSQDQKNSWGNLMSQLGINGGIGGVSSNNTQNSYQSFINELKSRYDYNKVKNGQFKY